MTPDAQQLNRYMNTVWHLPQGSARSLHVKNMRAIVAQNTSHLETWAYHAYVHQNLYWVVTFYSGIVISYIITKMESVICNHAGGVYSTFDLKVKRLRRRWSRYILPPNANLVRERFLLQQVVTQDKFEFMSIRNIQTKPQARYIAMMPSVISQRISRGRHFESLA